jgi:hypothetical protein
MNVIPFFRLRACMVWAVAILVGQAIFASAQTVLFDMGNDNTYRGLSVQNPDSLGNYWNSIGTGQLFENLIDIDNAPTTIDFGWSTNVGQDSYNGPAGPTDESTLETDAEFADVDVAALGNLGGAKRAVFDFMTGPGFADNRTRFEIQGLDPSKTYNLTFFGSHSFSTATTTVYSVYTDDTYTTSVGSATLDVQDSAMPWLHNRDRVATISNLSPQADNILYVQFVGSLSNGHLGYLNTMQLEGIAAAGVSGDFNDDDIVDAADYVVWRKNESANLPLPNDDELMSQAERFSLWRMNFGEMTTGGSGSGGSAAIPEPASLMLAVVVVIGMLSFKRRR